MADKLFDLTVGVISNHKGSCPARRVRNLSVAKLRTYYGWQDALGGRGCAAGDHGDLQGIYGSDPDNAQVRRGLSDELVKSFDGPADGAVALAAL